MNAYHISISLVVEARFGFKPIDGIGFNDLAIVSGRSVVREF